MAFFSYIWIWYRSWMVGRKDWEHTYRAANLSQAGFLFISDCCCFEVFLDARVNSVDLNIFNSFIYLNLYCYLISVNFKETLDHLNLQVNPYSYFSHFVYIQVMRFKGWISRQYRKNSKIFQMVRRVGNLKHLDYLNFSFDIC